MAYSYDYFRHNKNNSIPAFYVLLVVYSLAHLPADEGDLFLSEPLLQVHYDGVQGPAITVLDHHLNRE